MIDTSAIARGEPLRARIESATAAYLNAGGKIQQLPDSIGKPAPVKPAMFNNSCNPEADAKSRARGNRRSSAVSSLPLRKRGTPQAKQNEALREVWP